MSTLLVPIFENSLLKGGIFEWKESAHEIIEVIEEKEFLGKKGEIFILPRNKKRGRIILLGLGSYESFSLDVWKRSFGKAVRFLQEREIEDFDIFFSEKIEKKLGEDHAVRISVIEIAVASYQFRNYLTDQKHILKDFQQVSFLLEGERKKKNDDAQVREGNILGEAQNFTRELGNLPPIEMTPTYLAKEALKIGKKYSRMKVNIFSRDRLKKEGMGGILGVASGSSEEPKFIILEWMNAPKSRGINVFAGKSITFDSGGLSIKPASKMDEMKFDMLGGGSVLGAMQAIAALGLKVNVVALLPATENLSGANAYRPGDILRTKNGKTIEVLNTDAEGRIVLADALSYAQKYKPKFVLDLATLTGACMVALGGNYAGLFGRNQEVLEQIKQASVNSGEKVWQLPLDDDFTDEMKSSIADVKNIGGSGGGGASSAAAFLEVFTDYPWAHLDIAGVAWNDEQAHIRSGANGFGVPLLVELAKSWEREK